MIAAEGALRQAAQHQLESQAQFEQVATQRPVDLDLQLDEGTGKK